ncbi:MAG TPA: response regulator [Thermoanaerobaculia bacterium]|nr:response regulator [Thermoanaerobaculia bacterium]
MKPLLHLNLLGGFQAVDASGQMLSIPTRKGQALLAYIAVHPAAVHSRDKLASLLWSESGEEHARHSLRQTLLALRKIAPPEILLTENEQVSIVRELIEVDVIHFERALEAGGIESLREAARLYRGEFLEGMVIGDESIEEWLSTERSRLLDAAVGALGRICAEEVKAGLADWAIHTAHRLLALDPTQEVVHRTLMRLYFSQGRREAALRQYQLCAESLKRNFDIQPDSETRKLFDRIASEEPPRSNEFTSTAVLDGARKPVLILVVEDEMVTRVLIEGILSEAGYDVVQAEDGAEALLELGKRKFDLVLLDINIPTLDGLKLFEIMMRKGIDTPSIFVTALSDAEIRSRGAEMGATDFLRKPVSKDVLLTRVRMALGPGLGAGEMRDHA